MTTIIGQRVWKGAADDPHLHRNKPVQIRGVESSVHQTVGLEQPRHQKRVGVRGGSSIGICDGHLRVEPTELRRRAPELRVACLNGRACYPGARSDRHTEWQTGRAPRERRFSSTRHLE